MSLGQALVVVGLAALVVLVGVLVTLGGPVSRDRLARFALRQQLLVTPDDGDRLIRYLAVTRRWRSAGLVLGVVAPVVVGESRQYITGQPLHGNGLGWLFAGWFLGALVAEFRVNSRPSGTRRVAALYARTMRRYIGWQVWVLLAVVTILAVGATVLRTLRAPSLAAVVPGAIAAASAAMVWVVARRVLARAQPHLSPDEVVADEAIRSRSLHVLCGSGVAITSICLAQQLAPAEHHAAVLLTLSGVAVGWAIATARFRVDGEPARADGMVA